MARPKKLSSLQSIFNQLKEVIRAEVIADLSAVLGKVQGSAPATESMSTKVDGRKKRRKMSAAAREKIATAQKARWAKQKAAK